MSTTRQDNTGHTSVASVTFSPHVQSNLAIANSGAQQTLAQHHASTPWYVELLSALTCLL